jgi:hypothetical protein
MALPGLGGSPLWLAAGYVLLDQFDAALALGDRDMNRRREWSRSVGDGRWVK